MLVQGTDFAQDTVVQGQAWADFKKKLPSSVRVRAGKMREIFALFSVSEERLSLQPCARTGGRITSHSQSGPLEVDLLLLNGKLQGLQLRLQTSCVCRPKYRNSIIPALSFLSMCYGSRLVSKSKPLHPPVLQNTKAQ